MDSLSRLARSSGRTRLRALATVIVAGLVVVGVAGAVTSRSQTAPTSNSPPTISGNTTVGSTVTANPGTWNGSTPFAFQYQWQICDSGGNGCHDVAGATSQSYVIKSGDTGNTLRVHVIASNSDGSSSATSAASATIAASPSGPVNSTPPMFTGDTTIGSTLTTSSGTWTGSTPITFKYQWTVCDSNGNACHDIAGATEQSYQIKSGDVGNTVRVRVTASNPDNSTSATSVPSATIAVASATTGCPKLATGAQAVSIADVTSPARLQVDTFLLTTSSPIAGSMSSFSVRFHVSDTCGQAVSGAAVYVTAVPYNQVTIPGEATTDATGWVTLSFNRLAGFPASHNQQLMVLFVRARRTGDPALAGISTRRLISLPVNLRR